MFFGLWTPRGCQSRICAGWTVPAYRREPRSVRPLRTRWFFRSRPDTARRVYLPRRRKGSFESWLWEELTRTTFFGRVLS
jgi:hypothetical protein